MTENAGDQSRTDHPPHLITSPGSQWAFWRCVGLRAAGFPVTEVLKLSSPAASTAADRLIEAERKINVSENLLLDRLNAELDELKESNQWQDKDQRKTLLRAVSAVKAGKLPQVPRLRTETDTLRSSRLQADRLREEFDLQYESSVRDTSKAIRGALLSERFREAILWQNRHGFHTGAGALLAEQDVDRRRASKQKQHEELIASYLQRYCVKNDTIGFFGPVGWAKFTSQGEGLTFRPGENLIAARKTYFELWGVEALAKRIASNPAIKPWLKPVCVPFVYIEGQTLHHPSYGEFQLSPAQAAILALCGGELSVREIADKVLNSQNVEVYSEAEVVKILDQMALKGMISIGFKMPFDAFPERTLRRQLEEIAADHLRREAIALLDQLEEARDAVSASAGDADKLDRALEEIDETFTRLTGIAPTREHGKLYAARTLVYEDCRREIEVEIGSDILESLAAPISLLLISGRWFTFEFAKLYRRILSEVYEDLVRDQGSRFVSASQLWLKTQPFTYGERSDVNRPLFEDFRRRWEKLLHPDSDERRLQLSAESLRPRALAEFSAPRAGWSYARYHSPDIILLASDVEAVNRGDYQFVMGEFHLGTNTLSAALFYHQHPCPEELIRATGLDLPGRRVVPLTPKEFSFITARTSYALAKPDDLRLELGREAFAPDRSTALPISSLIVEDQDGALVARTRRGDLQIDLIELMGMYLSAMVYDAFKFSAGRPHTPRISIDRLIVSRETWRFRASGLEFAYEKGEANRFLAVRRWARSNDLPRWVFVKVPVEKKPFFVDFDSAIYAELFLKTVRRSIENGEPHSDVIITEMLPNPDQIWLQDNKGWRYTSEFRIVALDLIE